MMMIVGAAPDTARAQGINSKNPHEHFREARPGKDGVMLLIMVNHEKPENQKSGKDAAKEFCGGMKIPERASQRREQKGSGGKDMPPASGGGIFRKGFRR
jgi:hypothetical protein